MRRRKQHHRQAKLEGIGQIRLAWIEVSDILLLSTIEQALIEHFAPHFNDSPVSKRLESNGTVKSKLRSLLEKQGIDQKTLAARTGLSPTTVGKIYNNHFKALETHTVTTLMKYFKLKRIDDLIEVVWEDEDDVKRA